MVSFVAPSIKNAGLFHWKCNEKTRVSIFVGYFMLHLFVISHEWNINALQSSAELKQHTSNTSFYGNQGYLSDYYKKKGPSWTKCFDSSLIFPLAVLPGDTQTGCCAFPPPPH